MPVDVKKKMAKQTKDTDKSKLGSANWARGKSFENEVAELYRLQHYDVEQGRIFSGRQVDFFITRKLADFEIIRAIEAKSGPVKAEDIDSFLAKLRLVRKEYPAAAGTIISGSTFTDGVTAHAHAEGIQLTLFRDLAAQLFDGEGYVKNLSREISNNKGYINSLYIEPYVLGEVDEVEALAFEAIDEWIKDDNYRQLTLLGDVGTGKSFLSRMLASRLIENFRKEPLANPVPILIDLRNADRLLSLEGLILTHFAQSGFADVSFDTFLYALSHGRIVLILDGFDEMAARVTPQVTARNFNELIRTIEGQAKVVLTCRTHYFKSRSEEEAVLLNNANKYDSDTVKELYWDLISRKGFKIAYLQPFSETQIVNYVSRVKPHDTREVLTKIRKTYNLMELSKRPMLLSMIVQSIDKIGEDEINQATLYEVFTDVWIHRDKWRDVITPENKRRFLTELAQKLWQEGTPVVHHSQLGDYVKDLLASQIVTENDRQEVDNEIRTATFLTRDRDGNYGFAHKSFQEYFFARYLAKEFETDHFESLRTRRITPEVVSFLFYLCDKQAAAEKLKEILMGDYVPYVSENALLILYGLQKEGAHRSDNGESPFSIPENANLEGAMFEEADLQNIELSKTNLIGANFHNSTLAGAIILDSDLTAVNFKRADLSKANFSDSNLSESLLEESNCEGSDFSRCKVKGSRFSGTFLKGFRYDDVDFSEAIFKNATFSNEFSDYLRTQRGPSDDSSTLRSTAEKELWEKIIQHRPALLRSARRLRVIGFDYDLEDLVSQTIMELFSKKKDLEGLNLLEPIQLQTLLTRLLQKVGRDLMRNNQGRMLIEYLPEGSAEEPESNTEEVFAAEEFFTNNTDFDIESKIYVEEIAAIIREELKEEQYQIFHSYFIEEEPIEEISQKMGVSENKVHTSIRQFRRQVPQILKKRDIANPSI